MMQRTWRGWHNKYPKVNYIAKTNIKKFSEKIRYNSAAWYSLIYKLCCYICLWSTYISFPNEKAEISDLTIQTSYLTTDIRRNFRKEAKAIQRITK